MEAEIFLYDTLPGGAGFTSQLVDRGTELLERALRLVKTCPENCDGSCYRCLRSFKNKFEHGLLDRQVGAELLEYLITGGFPDFDAARLEKSTAALYRDLLRHDHSGINIEAGVKIQVPGLGAVKVPILVTTAAGKKFAITLSAPLTIDYPTDPQLRALQQANGDIRVIVANELLVRTSLPAATREVQQNISA